MLYTIVLSSNQRLSGTVVNAIYSIDWSVIPNAKYRVKTLFTSSTVNLTNITRIANLEVNLGQQQNVLKSSSTQTRATSTNNIGFLLPNSIGASTFLYGDNTTTPEFMLNHIPTTNDFQVRISTNDAIPLDWSDSGGGTMVDYVLILTLEKM